MKKKILGFIICLILVLFLTGCGSKEEKEEEQIVEETEIVEESIDYTVYTEDIVTKIVATSTLYYAIEDLDNDGIPELLTKTGSAESNANFKIYRYVDDVLSEVTFDNNMISFNGIIELSRNVYDDGSVIYVIDDFETVRTIDGGYIDLAYIKGNEYIEYRRILGLDLDTLSSSEIYKFVLNLDNYDVKETSYDFDIDTSATSMDKVVVSSKYNDELENDMQEIEQNLKSTEKVTFYQSSFSEWEHDDTELTQEVQKILEQLNNK